jgi:hypothetical protein
MPLVSEKQFQHIGGTKGCANYLHDLVHELSTKLDALWRYDQYIANVEVAPMEFQGSYIKTPCYDEYLADAGFYDHVRAFWVDRKRQSE